MIQLENRRPCGGRGERHWSAKLTWEKVRAIRALKNANRGVVKEVAEKFGVHFSVIYKIWSGQIWKDDGLKKGPKYLNEEVVREIRQMAGEGKTLKEISEAVNLTTFLVAKVVNGEVWDWVK